MRQLNIISILLITTVLSACSFLEPEPDNTRQPEILDDPAYFCGPLNAAYNALPTSFNVEMDALTDNAVIRNYSSTYYQSAVGGMTPSLNPLNNYEACYNSIRLLNIFLSRMVLNSDTSYQTPIRFLALNNESAYINNLRMFYRLKGEAFGLRAYWQYVLLRNYAGEGVNGELLGVPLVGDQILQHSQELNIPRSSFEDCIESIVADCDSAINCSLPDLYIGPTDIVTGQALSPRLSGAAVKAIKAKALLLAASPAFNKSGDHSKWERAALAAADAVKATGGINTAFFTRDDYYFGKINSTSITQNNVIMKGKWVTGNSSLESANYPSGMYGDAMVNVSQNLVDAFTDINGYPISESTIYDPSKPYANRDPRLDLFVGYHGGKIGNYTLNMTADGSEFYNPQTKTSRSGYYLKKGLRYNQVVCGPSNMTKGTARACIIIGLPEIYLMYAEAANEAWGVSGDPFGIGFTAKDALNRILVRDNAKGNMYLNNIVGSDQDKFREYVRLQRRIELCFEGHYYFDLRRWYASDSNWAEKINTSVYGLRYMDSGFKVVELEKRKYLAPYPPIPYSEQYNAGLVQNKGW